MVTVFITGFPIGDRSITQDAVMGWAEAITGERVVAGQLEAQDGVSGIVLVQFQDPGGARAMHNHLHQRILMKEGRALVAGVEAAIKDLRPELNRAGFWRTVLPGAKRGCEQRISVVDGSVYYWNMERAREEGLRIEREEQHHLYTWRYPDPQGEATIMGINISGEPVHLDRME